MSNINFDNPWLLLIAVPLIVLFTVPFVLAVRKENRNGHNITSQILHVVLAIIIAFAAAGTTVTTVLTETHVYVVADVSYSANKNLDAIDNIIKNQLKLPSNSKVGIVTFGKDYELLCGLTDQKNVKSVKDYSVDDSETNIAEAMEYAGTLFEGNAIKRVVLITDAKQTDEVDTTAMRRAVDTLITNGIKVDAYYLDNNITPGTAEVQISSAEYTPSAFINHKENVTVFIQSTVETQAIIYLDKNDVNYSTWAGKLTAGNNTVSLKLDTSTSGVVNYKVRVETVPKENDTSDYNNEYSFTQQVSGDMRVLIVTNEWADCQDLINQYEGSGAKLDVYENSSASVNLKKPFYDSYKNNDDVNIYCFNRNLNENTGITKGDVPFIIEELCKYDEIILSNLDISTVANVKPFIEALDITVGSFGKSLVTLGNTYIAGSSNQNVKKYSDMLPVRFGQSSDAAKLYTIILDSSRSMFYNSRIQVAKAFAKKMVHSLNYGDQVMIVGFYGDAWTIYGPRQFTDADAIVQRIDSVEVKQGTVLSGGLRRAYEAIKPSISMYGDKQVMIITDGRDQSSDYAEAEELVADMYEDGIVTSIVDVGRDNDDANAKPYGKPNTSDPAYQFLQRIVAVGASSNSSYTYYNSTAHETLPDAAWGSMAQGMNETKCEKVSAVKINKAFDEILLNFPKGDDIPKISGYYIGSAKASATSVLQVEYNKSANKTISLPLYAYWSYGNGKVSSFTSTFSGKNWMSSWENLTVSTGESLQKAFYNNILDVNTPLEKAAYPYLFSVTRDGSSTNVLVTPHKDTLHFNADATIKINLPNGQMIEDSLIFSRDHYYYEFKSAEVGRYQIEVTYSFEGWKYSSTSILNVSYTNEYDEFASFEASPLFRAVNGRGQIVVSHAENGELVLPQLTLENKEHEMATYTNDFTLPLLIIAVVLFVVDIVIRKLKWEDIVSFFGGSKKSKSGGKKA